ncbi:MAG TPA: hypothetical protein VJ770_29450 [Stellaceae bacterium]|nr:hypothetical protein [Stellaceae bacterium]
MTLAAPLKRGPPCKYTPDLAQQILDAMLRHGSLRRACEREPALPDRETVRKWLMAQPEFAAAYARVRATLVEDWVDDMIEIADDNTIDPLSRRVMVETRRWIASKLAPGRFGDKVQIGGNAAMLVGGSPISLSDLSNAELDALEAFCEARLARMSVAEPAGNIGVAAAEDRDGDG